MLTGDDKNLPQSDFQRVYNEMVKKFEEIDNELAMSPRIFIDKGEPNDMKNGDTFINILDAGNIKK